MIYQTFPFLQSFPFEEYKLSEGKDSDHHQEVFKKEDLYDFQYRAADKDVTISFYKEDIEFLNMISENVKKLDSLRENIDEGLKSSNMLVKFKSIEKSKAFLKKVNSPAEDVTTFRSVLDGLQEINEVSLSEGIIKKINRLDKKLVDFDFTVNELMAVHAYLDFQLHHVKIMLGVVIASKIH